MPLIIGQFLADYGHGIYQILSFVCKLIGIALVSFWPVLMLMVGFFNSLLPQLNSMLDWLKTQIPAFYSMMGNASTSLQAQLAAGWPPEFATAVGYVNRFVPIGECLLMVTSLFGFWIVCSTIRVVKSLIPTYG